MSPRFVPPSAKLVSEEVDVPSVMDEKNNGSRNSILTLLNITTVRQKVIYNYASISYVDVIVTISYIISYFLAYTIFCK